MRKALVFFSAVLVSLVFAQPAGADDFGYTGGDTRYGDYGPGHGAASWGESTTQTSYCFSGFSTASRDEIRFGMNQVDFETSGMSIGEFGCNSHVDVVFIECTSNCPPGGTTFTPTSNYLGVSDSFWVIVDVPTAYASLVGTNCGGGLNGFEWYLRRIATEGAGIALGLHQSFDSNDAMDATEPPCSWNVYVFSGHHKLHIASWQ